jgi:gamma-glutamyltranspeptidase/glutathione hydrolase
MLGEEDLNPLGFHRWNRRKRMPTLISPSLLIDKNGKVDLVIGSAGSNRIRSAIIQVISNYTLKKLSLKDSIYHSRLHLENNFLHIEPGITIDNNLDNRIETNLFSDINLFFGGVNAVTETEAVADPRRGGMGIIC